MIEALFYNKQENYVECVLCPNNCVIKSGRRGICGVRENREGKLYSLNYAKVSAIADDPIEKKPLVKFHPGARILSIGTIGCNLHCKHCQNYSISQCTPEKAGLLKDLSVSALVGLAIKDDFSLVGFTYNEPIVWYEYVLEAAKALKKKKIETVLVTNGYINPAPLKKLLPYIDAYSLDIKWSRPQTAKKLSGVSNPEAIFEMAKTVFQAGKHLEVVTNLVDGYNDSSEELQAIAQFISQELSPEVPWHLSRSFPAHQLQNLRITPSETLEKAKQIGQNAGLKNIQLGNV